MTAIRHLLFCLLVLVGFSDIRAVSAETQAGDPWTRGHSAVVATLLAPCHDGMSPVAIEIAAPAEFLPDLLPPEREGDVAGRPPSGGVAAVRFAEARDAPCDPVVERRPGHGFSPRAPPLSS
jgi:hypothetical protein